MESFRGYFMLLLLYFRYNIKVVFWSFKICVPYISPAVFNTTEDGWIIYNDTQYFINTDLLPMEAARAYCKKNFGELAVITGDSERKFLWKQVKNKKYNLKLLSDLIQSGKLLIKLNAICFIYVLTDKERR